MEMALEFIFLRNLIASIRLPEGDAAAVYEDSAACIDFSNHAIGGRERAMLIMIDIQKH